MHANEAPSDAAGLAAGAGAYVLWGLLTVYWHELSGVSAFELIGQRIVWSSLVLVVLLTATRRWPAMAAVVHNRRLLVRVVAASVLLSANWTCYVWAVTHHNVIETALGYFIAPLVTVAIGVARFREHLRRGPKLALALAAVAVVVLTIENGRVPAIALILSGSWSLYVLLKRQVPLPAVESLAAEAFVLIPAALVTIAIVEHGRHGIVAHAPTHITVLVLFAGIVTVVPLLMFAYAAPRVPFTILGPLQYFVPCINFVLGVAAYHEAMTPWRVAGFALVWVALAIFTVDSLRHLPPSAGSARAPARGLQIERAAASSEPAA